MRRRPAFHPITIEDRALLDARLRAAGYPLCEYTFATLFCWGGCNQTSFALADDWLLIHFNGNGEEGYLCPVGTGDPTWALDFCLEDLAARGQAPVVKMVPEKVAAGLSKTRYKVTLDRPNCDYVYERSALAELKGRHYSRKRNFIRRFLRSCNSSISPLTKEDIAGCIRLVKEWREGVQGCGNLWLDFEVEACLVCLYNFAELHLLGCVLRVDGCIKGFAIGEPLTRDMFVVHYEKAVRECEGIYPVLTQNFARLIPPTYTLVNREQDLGVEGLRQAKESYFPLRLEPAYFVEPI